MSEGAAGTLEDCLVAEEDCAIAIPRPADEEIARAIAINGTTKEVTTSIGRGYRLPTSGPATCEPRHDPRSYQWIFMPN